MKFPLYRPSKEIYLNKLPWICNLQHAVFVICQPLINKADKTWQTNVRDMVKKTYLKTHGFFNTSYSIFFYQEGNSVVVCDIYLRVHYPFWHYMSTQKKITKISFNHGYLVSKVWNTVYVATRNDNIP